MFCQQLLLWLQKHPKTNVLELSKKAQNVLVGDVFCQQLVTKKTTQKQSLSINCLSIKFQY